MSHDNQKLLSLMFGLVASFFTSYSASAASTFNGTTKPFIVKATPTPLVVPVNPISRAGGDTLILMRTRATGFTTFERSQHDQCNITIQSYPRAQGDVVTLVPQLNLVQEHTASGLKTTETRSLSADSKFRTNILQLIDKAREGEIITSQGPMDAPSYSYQVRIVKAPSPAPGLVGLPAPVIIDLGSFSQQITENKAPESMILRNFIDYHCK